MSSEIDYTTRILFGEHTQNAQKVRLTSSLVLYPAHTENSHADWVWLRHSYSIRHTQNAHVEWDWLQHSYFIRYVQTRTCQGRLPQVLHSIRNVQKRTCQVRLPQVLTLFGTLRKRTCWDVKGDWTQVSYSIRHAQKSHLSDENDLSHSNRCVQKTYISVKVDSSLVLYSARTESDMLSKIDLKSRTLLGLGTDIRFVYFLSYFKNISLGRMNSSLVLDSTLGCSSFLYCYCYSSAYLTAAND